ncbi:MAG: ChaN family lipoprotein [Bacteroidetes bacterium]|nr:ChaN family lipoprotein [Bacteroidota bacterium]
MKWVLTLVCGLVCGNASLAQPVDSTRFDPAGHFVVYTGESERTDLSAIVSAMADADLIFLGEEHNDPTGHALELMLLEAAHRQYGSSREVILGMEMFERDVQPVLDEYLAGFIREQDFLKASRPWSNYETDYRPLIEYAKEHGLEVVATNTPSRYVGLARRRGLAALDSLMSSWAWLPHAMPMTGVSDQIAPPSPAYEARFRAEMEEMGAHGPTPGMPSADAMLVAQNLRDATMAFAIGFPFSEKLVLHINGSFHSADGLGIPEHRARFSSVETMLIITMLPVDDIHVAAEPTNDDFIILTDEGLISE